jgi:hypothetical protein
MIEQTTKDVTSIHRLAASRHPRATAVPPPAAGSGTRAHHSAPARVITALSAIGTDTPEGPRHTDNDEGYNHDPGIKEPDRRRYLKQPVHRAHDDEREEVEHGGGHPNEECPAP